MFVSVYYFYLKKNGEKRDVIRDVWKKHMSALKMASGKPISCVCRIGDMCTPERRGGG